VNGSQPDLSIVVVSWNTRALLERCLGAVAASLAAAPLAAETFVVDNGSSDGSPALVRERFPWVHLIANDRNRGFTAANNQALRLARGRHLLLLNSDAEPLGGALAALVRFLDEHPRAGACGPELLNPDGSHQSSRRRFPTLATALVESTTLQRFVPARHPLLRRYYALDLPDHRAAPVDWVVGACLVVRRRAAEQVGLLDEGFFMYSEELDWCRRLRSAGWEVWYVPSARVVHHGGGSSGRDLLHRHRYFHESKCRYFAKYHGRLTGTVLRLYLLLTYVAQFGEEALKLLLGHKPALRRQRLELIAGVLRWQAARLGHDLLDRTSWDALTPRLDHAAPVVLERGGGE